MYGHKTFYLFLPTSYFILSKKYWFKCNFKNEFIPVYIVNAQILTQFHF